MGMLAAAHEGLKKWAGPPGPIASAAYGVGNALSLLSNVHASVSASVCTVMSNNASQIRIFSRPF